MTSWSCSHNISSSRATAQCQMESWRRTKLEIGTFSYIRPKINGELERYIRLSTSSDGDIAPHVPCQTSRLRTAQVPQQYGKTYVARLRRHERGTCFKGVNISPITPCTSNQVYPSDQSVWKEGRNERTSLERAPMSMPTSITYRHTPARSVGHGEIPCRNSYTARGTNAPHNDERFLLSQTSSKIAPGQRPVVYGNT